MKHRLWKRIAALALSLSLALGCAACSGGAGSSASGGVSASGSAPAESASQAQDQIVLTDQAGREVVLEGPAQSIVSCYYISTYAAIALGAEDRVAGLEKKADTRPIYQMAAPELLEKPQVGTMKELDVEATAALEPELVIMPQALADYAGTLTQLGIPVLVVNPESHEALVEMLQLMGTALGLEDRAEALASYYQEQLDRMAELTQDAGAPVVYMGSNSFFLATAPASISSGRPAASTPGTAWRGTTGRRSPMRTCWPWRPRSLCSPPGRSTPSRTWQRTPSSPPCPPCRTARSIRCPAASRSGTPPCPPGFWAPCG